MAGEFDFTQYDYVVDAMDTVTGKLALIDRARTAGAPLSAAWPRGTSWTPRYTFIVVVVHPRPGPRRWRTVPPGPSPGSIGSAGPAR